MAFRTNKEPVLQEKTASGSVASFNTALAMPLASCNIAVNAWQEGSGDPSPDNVRPIHGFSEVNATRCSVNLCDEVFELGGIDATTGEDTPSTTTIRTKNYIRVEPNAVYYLVTPSIIRFRWYDINKNCIGNLQYNTSGNVTIPNNCYYARFVVVGVTSYGNNISLNNPNTDHDYHAYTGNTYTIQLGQEVYGAEVDVVNGVAHITHQITQIKDIDLRWTSGNGGYFYSLTLDKADGVMNVMSDVLQLTDLGLANMPNYSIKGASNGNTLYIKATDYTDVASLKEAIGDYYIVYELAEPFDIQLTPQQIETLIGNNTIFADTGDVDLTFNDLDIAKRGSFREVFKLP